MRQALEVRTNKQRAYDEELQHPSNPKYPHQPVQPSQRLFARQALEVLTNERQRRVYNEELRVATRLAQAAEASAAAAAEGDEAPFILADPAYASPAPRPAPRLLPWIA